MVNFLLAKIKAASERNISIPELQTIKMSRTNYGLVLQKKKEIGLDVCSFEVI